MRALRVSATTRCDRKASSPERGLEIPARSPAEAGAIAPKMCLASDRRRVSTRSHGAIRRAGYRAYDETGTKPAQVLSTSCDGSLPDGPALDLRSRTETGAAVDAWPGRRESSDIAALARGSVQRSTPAPAREDALRAGLEELIDRAAPRDIGHRHRWVPPGELVRPVRLGSPLSYARGQAGSSSPSTYVSRSEPPKSPYDESPLDLPVDTVLLSY